MLAQPSSFQLHQGSNLDVEIRMRPRYIIFSQTQTEAQHGSRNSTNLERPVIQACCMFLNDEVSAASALSNLRKHQERTAQTHFAEHSMPDCQVSRGICQQTEHHPLVGDTGINVSIHFQLRSECHSPTASIQYPTCIGGRKFPVCKLDNSDMVQTNKHMMNNCSNAKALERYCNSQRHNNVLSLLAGWILSTKSTEQELFVDLPPENWNPIDQVFQPASLSSRYRLVINKRAKIFVLALTICHETNLVNSKNYKINKYNTIQNLLQSAYRNFDVQVFTHEIYSSGFIVELNDF